MQFATLEFAAFFLITLTLSWVLRPWRLWQKTFLLLASYSFYAALRLEFVAIIFVSSLLFYFAGKALTMAQRKGARLAWLWVGVVLNLLLLAVFKYYNFFTDSVADLFSLVGLSSPLPVIEILFPVGISFYVFQGISYILDLYWKRGLQAPNLLDFLLFQAFFPQLLAGPICRSRELLEQIVGSGPRGLPELNRAATLILSGLFKKVVLAHFIDAHLVLNVFTAPENYTAPALWMGMLGYTMLIYWDFSGYTDLARGLGLLLGFEIPENFDHPYIARDISDFWRRWHITLSFWLRDYLFLPLASKWSGGLRRWLDRKQSALWGSQLAVLVTFVLCGLWHGAAWTFVLWGTYHGILLFVHHGLRNGLRLRWRGGWWGTTGTLLLVMLGWVLFNSADISTAGLYFSRMLDFKAAGTGFELLVVPFIALGLLLQIWGPRLRAVYIRMCERLPFFARPVAWFATGMVVLMLKPSGIAPYIYFGF